MSSILVPRDGVVVVVVVVVAGVVAVVVSFAMEKIDERFLFWKVRPQMLEWKSVRLSQIFPRRAQLLRRTPPSLIDDLDYHDDDSCLYQNDNEKVLILIVIA
jgi:hypothetical protein